MAQNITSSGSQTVATYADAVFIQVNLALTGTIIVQAGGVTQATITNPTVGTQYRYGNLHGKTPVTVNPSTTTDISVTITAGNQ